MKFINVLIGFIYSFVVITLLMPNDETFTNWRWWIGGVVMAGIIAGVVSIHTYRINEMEKEIELLKKELENKNEQEIKNKDYGRN